MVPEIILTKEWVKKLRKLFYIAEVFHSSISIKRRRKIWFNLISGVQCLLSERDPLYSYRFKN